MAIVEGSELSIEEQTRVLMTRVGASMGQHLESTLRAVLSSGEFDLLRPMAQAELDRRAKLEA